MGPGPGYTSKLPIADMFSKTAELSLKGQRKGFRPTLTFAKFASDCPRTEVARSFVPSGRGTNSSAR